MIVVVILLIGLSIGGALGASSSAIFIMAVCQLVPLLLMIRTRNVTATGAYLFMSFLFFGMRPIYMVIENDYELFMRIFSISPSLEICNKAMWWATLGTIAFYAGSQGCLQLHSQYFKQKAASVKKSINLPLVTNGLISFLVIYQVVSLGVMAKLKGGNLYGSALGAYLYDLPVMLQSGHIFALVLIFERYLKTRSIGLLILFGFSGFLFLILTWQMREMTMFRGFYITGIMVAGIAGLARFRSKVGYLWLIMPIMILLPTFRQLGENRYASNEELSEQLKESAGQYSNPFAPYWHFFDGAGDMNIFDSFVAATEAKPSKHPYILSWLYVPVHFFPRAIWTSKPEKGMLVDHSFSNGAPYSPGLAGYFVLDGGLIWMVFCMALLGYILGGIDGYILSMAPGYLRCCLQGIVVINGLYLTRFFLWQSFYQVLYAVIPCILLNYLVEKRMRISVDKARKSKRLAAIDKTGVLPR